MIGSLRPKANALPIPFLAAPFAEEHAIHPEFTAEAAYIAQAYQMLEVSRVKAAGLRTSVTSGRGGTHQSRYTRDVLSEKVAERLDLLDIGDQSLIFGRIDRPATEASGPDVVDGDERFYIGRVAVWSPDHDPLVVDWRAPIAEPFYRATGVEPLGLTRRRHFISRGRELLGLEDEFFGDRAAENHPVTAMDGDGRPIQGEGALVASLESARTGRLGDIVGTIQAEQDEIIRSEKSGILVVQGGPGTGKTVVALHRAAYLLYSHRFPLEGQGVLVLGPNRLFLTYIEQVLPALGESGVHLAVLGDLVPGVRVQDGDPIAVARVKGDLRMTDLIRRAVRDRQRRLREDLIIPLGVQRLRLSVDDSREIIAIARRKAQNHNHGRKFVVEEVLNRLTRSSRHIELELEDVKEQLDGNEQLRETLEWMWPVLTPSQLLHDLYGSKALLRAAAGSTFSEEEVLRLFRPWTSHRNVLWTQQDVPVLDEARAHLGARPGRKSKDEIRTWGHIVIDEAQDMSPMELRMVSRRSLNGSMTVVGDIAQATSAWGHDQWDSLLEHLPDRSSRMAELTVGYRLPGPTMDLAAKVLEKAVPGLKPPVAVRKQGADPRFVAVAEQGSVHDAVVAAIEFERAEIGAGNIAVLATRSTVPALSAAMEAAGVVHGVTYGRALEREVSIIAVDMVKGLEIDSAIVVEPATILDQEPQPYKSLYVAVTRATRRLTIVHQRPLPNFLRPEAVS